MDGAALRERRLASKRRVRRRRQLFGAGCFVIAVGLVVVLTTSGGERPRQREPSARLAPVPQPPVPPAAAQRPASVMAGAHRAPREAVPILMYHVIGDHRAGVPYPGLWVSPADFAAHVRALKTAGYHGVTLRQVWNAWHRGGRLPSKPVVVSFDDGYRGQVRDALPTLASAGWPGVLNLLLENLGDVGGTRAIRRLIRAGWEIDSHTLTHPDLTTLGAQRLQEELATSRARLRRTFHVPVSFFCYPSGRHDAAVIAAVKRAGYLAATTTEPGWASPRDDPFTLPRVRVDGGIGADELLRRLGDLRTAAGA